MKHIRPFVLPCARCIFVLALVATAAASAQSVVPAASNQVTLSLDQDLITFVKAGAWVAGIFLAIFAFIAVGFFGWDVAQTRKAMQDARDDLNKRMGEIRLDHQALKELKERLEKLGAELVEQIEKKTAADPSVPPSPAPAPAPAPAPQQDTKPDEPNQDGPLSQSWRTNEEKRLQVRQVIAAAEFEWTTLGTLAKKTGLGDNEIIALTVDDPLVQRGIGARGQMLFRLRHFNDPNSVGIGDAVREMTPWSVGTRVLAFDDVAPPGRGGMGGKGSTN
ncbi:hypothetical protein GNX71_29120 [Variovorax sp. RKNM96]|uniref:hypothetical protein n=1 Tax=Variovorax sp. RKNM96 TaxID=2681552 RepID=UPI00197F61C5|nr:hypothetical protein [Variovorax sp. RKNM96]QSI33409.1 hypothetical protein GNX71_29120 [Variovorax sp. RKNM96]